MAKICINVSLSAQDAYSISTNFFITETLSKIFSISSLSMVTIFITYLFSVFFDQNLSTGMNLTI